MYLTALLPLALPEPLTYRLPEGMTAQVGCRVRVPLGARNTYVGVVVALHDSVPQGGFEIKDVAQVLDPLPTVSPLMLKLWQWIADYYLCPAGDVVRAALPQDNRKAAPKPPKEHTATIFGSAADSSNAYTLSPAQQNALDGIHAAFGEKDVVLLHGVTSSGKTAIYTRLIAETAARGQQVLYLVPEIGLTTQLTERLRRTFGDAMGVFHSRLSAVQRRDLWLAQAGDAPLPLILGARSAVFLPWQRLGLVIIDEEHEPSYKQEEPAPRYHARSVALMLARMAGAKALLGTATPSIETYNLALGGRYGLVTLTERFNAVLPHLEVVDTALLRHRKQMKGLLSPRLMEAMRGAMERGEQTVLFASRRGYAAMLECKACGWVPRCQQCDVSLAMHRREHCLVCHYCGHVYPVPTCCPACHATEIGQRGMGTEKVEEAVRELFPEARVARMDLDSTKDKDAYTDIIAGIEERRTDVLVGTQMVTKGLDFEGVTLVGVVSADGVLSQPDFRAHERAYHLMSQVAGRAGRRDRQGEVILQTRQADLPVIGQVVRGAYREMYADAMAERQLFVYPPFCRIIDVYVRHRAEAMVERAAQDFARSLLSANPAGITVLGPDAPAHARVAGLSIRKIMIKVLPQCDAKALRRLLLKLQQEESRAQVYFDVDPV